MTRIHILFIHPPPIYMRRWRCLATHLSLPFGADKLRTKSTVDGDGFPRIFRCRRMKTGSERDLRKRRGCSLPWILMGTVSLLGIRLDACLHLGAPKERRGGRLRLRGARGMPRRGPGGGGGQGPPVPAHPLRPQPSDVKFSELGGIQGGLGAEQVLPRRAPALPGSRRRASSLGDVAPRGWAGPHLRPKIPPAFPNFCGRALSCPAPDAAPQPQGCSGRARWPWHAVALASEDTRPAARAGSAPGAAGAALSRQRFPSARQRRAPR